MLNILRETTEKSGRKSNFTSRYVIYRGERDQPSAIVKDGKETFPGPGRAWHNKFEGGGDLSSSESLIQLHKNNMRGLSTLSANIQREEDEDSISFQEGGGAGRGNHFFNHLLTN